MVGVAGTIAFIIAVGLVSSAGAAKNKKRSFTETVISASITSDGSEGVSKVTDSVDGQGAGVTTTTVTGGTYPIRGSDKSTDYFANGVQRSTDAFTLTKPDANGISKITARGRCTGGTGVHRHLKCTFTFSGTVDTKPGGISKVRVTGTYTL